MVFSEPTNTPNPPEWASTEFDQVQRLAALERLTELGMSGHVVAKLCGVQVRRVRKWQVEGFPTQKGNRSMKVLDRLGGLIMHMAEDLRLSYEKIAEFLQREPTSTDWQIDDSMETNHWRNTPIVQTKIRGYYLEHPGESFIEIEQRLQERFPGNYSEYLERSDSATASE